MEFNLELKRITEKINKEKPKTVLIQLPSGLKPKATFIAKYLEKNTKAKILIWFGSNYGACDIPNVKNIDLLIHFGHSKL